MRGSSHLIICPYGSPLDGIRSIAFLAKGLACFSVCRFVFRKRHPLADDFSARLVFWFHGQNPLVSRWSTAARGKLMLSTIEVGTLGGLDNPLGEGSTN